MTYSQQLVNFLKIEEKYKEQPYKCSKDADFQTIGYGHKDSQGEYIYISKEQAEHLLIKDIEKVERELRALYPKFIHLDQSKRDAVTSLVFNWGIGNFSKSKLFKYLKEHNYKNASHEFLDIVKSKGKVMGGLVKRRQKEADIFLHGW